MCPTPVTYGKRRPRNREAPPRTTNTTQARPHEAKDGVLVQARRHVRPRQHDLLAVYGLVPGNKLDAAAAATSPGGARPVTQQDPAGVVAAREPPDEVAVRENTAGMQD
jgi:hypothetical protein